MHLVNLAKKDKSVILQHLDTLHLYHPIISNLFILWVLKEHPLTIKTIIIKPFSSHNNQRQNALRQLAHASFKNGKSTLKPTSSYFAHMSSNHSCLFFYRIPSAANNQNQAPTFRKLPIRVNPPQIKTYGVIKGNLNHMVNVLNFNVNITHDDDTFLCFESSHKSIITFEWNTLSCSFYTIQHVHRLL